MRNPYRVFKYPVPIEGRFTVAMPEGAAILDVQVQGNSDDMLDVRSQADRVMMWALVNPDAPKVERSFRLVGTGHPIDPIERGRLQHIATFQIGAGSIVFHVFEAHA